ncbi:MAG: DUF4230 domain-containing protein [Bacteroidaceae bacterium]|nr:DUF4230 domain-containing protein [Bacteroidaceae bacterium]
MKKEEQGKPLSKAIQYLLFGILALAFIALAAFLVKSCLPKPEEVGEQLPLEDTSAIIESVRPKGELYIYSLVAEDFVTKQETEHHVLLFPEEHSCVQVVQQKISFVLDLDKIKYVPDSGKVVLVQLPDIRYVASTQDSRFMSDDEDYWKDHNTDPMKHAVENKLKKKYDTPKIRQQAKANAQKTIGDLLARFGYEARFVSGNIERTDGVETLKSVK